MTHSLNEIESLARKAVRGAGYSWGLAEDASKAVRFLCAAGLPGAEALAGWISENDGGDYASHCPNCADTNWAAPGGLLCPLITGAALCDRAESFRLDTQITIAAIAYPILLIPALASASDLAETGLMLAWPGVTYTRMDRESWIDATPAALASPWQESVTVTVSESRSGTRLHRCYRGHLPDEAAKTLHRFAHRTYAPETEASRLAGAGAGLTDND